jgi:hypothetical protein
MPSLRLTSYAGCLFTFLAAGLASAGCQNNGGGSGGGGGSGVSTDTVFQPQGCQFQIAARAEYKDWSSGKTDVGATPNIRRVRLGLGGNVAPGSAGKVDPTTTMAFAWQTDDGTLASQVAWGDSPDPAKWPASNLASGVTWLTPEAAINGDGDARMHEAYVCGLQPATTYYYRVGGGPAGKEVWSDVYSFTTLPSDPGAEITIAATGDSRGQNNDAWQFLQQRWLGKGVSFQIFSGDVANLATDQGEWEKWLDFAWKDKDGKLSSLGQLLTVHTHGNHENHSTLFYGNMVLPQDVKAYPNYPELFFSFDAGPVHVLVVDDAFIVNPSGDQAFLPLITAWLEADLDAANKNRAKVPWIIATHHHAEFSSSNHGQDADVLRGRAYFVPLWDKYHLDLSVAGHDHDYERTKPLNGPADKPAVAADFSKGTEYIVCGGAGADPYTAGTSDFTAASRDTKSGGAIGLYTLIHASKTQLRIDAHELRADGSDPMFDTVTITK